MSSDEKVKIEDFVKLMWSLRQYEETTGDTAEIGDSKEQCKTCGHAVCQMIQKNNPPLLCYTKYNGPGR